ncbi:branched-chain alpha-keto acid dehydrogenase subunit E2 [Achromobacter piechaudii]|uniref:Acetyltransferase component of pyruvate dehydrogenase complex n=2 Tax=Achromobacter piechaudii TaxID=72556 RepID=A0ABN7EVK7_9BURK|nr:pyruvate dehydrogenase complex dihydrolipoamide acetyltransferase [Achromobacter piechaudii]KNY11707.1 branched-chain alpha-keto acid dehydrogenase subunit E2 [Achromobacter piechaudii]CAB3673318.1 Dihydrolipoyllysine-residue acetyltransferase component of pyruvate dehydrogenase complex [Achromobacter piechaudii]CAB3838109.1 Dihydrolipoyllysine-residue acetyltransferase component of pyruvate dehydrogenase complex [Achromobacter piechaudii]CAB3942813.1 Dihydrolipoyllysine-residue acetyltransf
MAHLIKLPSVAADTSGGNLHQWLKQEGDTVAVGDALAEIETEKAIVEINAEHAGVLGRIVVPAGAANVPINTVIGVLLAQGDDASAIDRALAEHGGAAAKNAEPASGGAASAATTSGAAAAAVAPTAPAPATPASTVSPASSAAVPGGRLFASPLARRLAAQWHVDLLGVTGTGPHGRIVRRDVEAVRDRAPVDAAAPLGARAARPAARRVPHTGMRRAIARRLTESKQHVPHFYLSVDCKMDALLALRAQANQGGTVKLSVNDFIVRAAALALREVPEVNVSWHEDAIEYHAGADISVAVATDGGLVTPIVRDADVKPLSAIAGEIVELAGRAKINRLKPEEFTGGSLTVSNLGMYGIREFAAIINPPQAAILAVGAAERRPIVGDDGELVAATVMTVTLSADHRAVDGAVGARWLAALRTLIENPVRILL